MSNFTDAKKEEFEIYEYNKSFWIRNKECKVSFLTKYTGIKTWNHHFCSQSSFSFESKEEAEAHMDKYFEVGL